MGKERLKERFEIRSTTVGIDESAGEVDKARILNRIIRVSGEGWEYEADQRRADLIIKGDRGRENELPNPPRRG